MPLGDFTLGQALGVRLSATEAPSLALVGSTDRDTDRYRLLIVGADRQTLYDEILDHYPRITAARRSDGSHALFVSGERGTPPASSSLRRCSPFHTRLGLEVKSPVPFSASIAME